MSQLLGQWTLHIIKDAISSLDIVIDLIWERFFFFSELFFGLLLSYDHSPPNPCFLHPDYLLFESFQDKIPCCLKSSLGNPARVVESLVIYRWAFHLVLGRETERSPDVF